MKNALKFKKFPQIFYRHCSFQIIKKFGHGKVWKKTSKLSIGLKNYIDFAKQRKFSVKKETLSPTKFVIYQKLATKGSKYGRLQTTIKKFSIQYFCLLYKKLYCKHIAILTYVIYKYKTQMCNKSFKKV